MAEHTKPSDDWGHLRLLLQEIADAWNQRREVHPFAMDELCLWWERDHDSQKRARCPRCGERTGPVGLTRKETVEAECFRCGTTVEFGHRPYERTPYQRGYDAAMTGEPRENIGLPYDSFTQRGISWLCGWRAGAEDYRRSKGLERPYPEPER